MPFSQKIPVIAVISLLTACGGGGGGGGGSDSSQPIATARLMTLDADNISEVAEIFRQEFFDPILLFQAISSSFFGGVPQFNLTNDTQTIDCSASGNVRATVRASGAEIEQVFDQCLDTAGLEINGELSYTFENVNQSAQTYTLTFTYRNFDLQQGAEGTAFNGETSVDVRLDGSGMIFLDVESNRTVSDSIIGESYTSESLSFSVRYNGSFNTTPTITDVSGSLALGDRGVLDLTWLSSEQRILMTGDGDERGYITLSGDRYGVEFVDGDGSSIGTSVRGADRNNLEVFAENNSAPVFRQQDKLYFVEGESISLDLDSWLYDVNLDVLSVTPTVMSAPAGALYELQDQQGFTLGFTTDTPGEYLLRVLAEDPDGLFVEGDIPFEVVVDSDNDGVGDHEDVDDDNDGVADTEDAFPLDDTESVDSDGDGIGNNADTDDDNDGTDDVADAFPLNPMCQSIDQSEDGVCISELIAGAEEISVDDTGVIYFLVESRQKVFRWSTATQEFLTTIELGGATPSDSSAEQMAYSSSHNRLYFGYNTGPITSIDISAEGNPEQALVNLPQAVNGLVSVGNYLLAQDASGSWATHYTIASDGTIADQEDWNRNSRVYTWDPVNHRVYFFRDGTSPNDLHYEEIEQSTGAIVAEGETPYHGDYGMMPPITVSEDGNFILIGSGNIFNASDLTWAGAVPGDIAGALWTTTDGIIALRTEAGRALVERRDSDLAVQERVAFNGVAVDIVQTINGIHVISVENGNTVITPYVPSDDSDSDGVTNNLDAFPLDIAASVDTDYDGYPDAWNPGYEESDSTTGLSLDAYPDDAACHLLEHGDGTRCDYDRVIPVFSPDRIVSDEAGIIYMLSADNNRVYRWSIVAQGYLAPLVIGDPAAINSVVPRLMTYSAGHGRLYFGYSSGEVTFIDLASPQLGEQAFATVAESVDGIGDAGSHVLVQDNSGAWETHYIFNANGELRDSMDWNHYSRVYAWNETLKRIYFFRDGTSPNDLHYEEIDATSGTIIAEGETTYHGDYIIRPPLLISPDDTRVLLGSGDIYDANNLSWTRSLANSFDHAVWLSNNEVITLRPLNGGARLDHYNANLNWSAEQHFAGTPIGIFAHENTVVVITETSEGLTYSEYFSP